AIDLAHLGGVHASPLPPGVTVRAAGSKTLLGPRESVGRLVLEAKPDAPPSEKVPIAVMGHVSINFVVKTAYSSAPILVTVVPKAGK
ncbi:MAG TPA: pre-peptidase, partial [Isosphaeraceae bacterium]